MITRLLVLPIILTFVLASCIEKKDIDKPDIINTRDTETRFKSDNTKKIIELNKSKIISANGTENFTLNNTVQEIESKSGIRLNLSEATDECYTEDSNSGFQLLFLKDVLISISFFDSSYQTIVNP